MHLLKDAFKRYVMSNQSRLKFANFTMLASALAFVIATYLAYGLESYLPIAVVAVSHISQIVLAGVFKVSYVVRLVYQKQLGMDVC